MTKHVTPERLILNYTQNMSLVDRGGGVEVKFGPPER